LKVREYLLGKIAREGAIHITLIDPEKQDNLKAAELAAEAEEAGTAAIMVGGSTLASADQLDLAVKAIKERVKVPVILFPSNIAGISPHADAVWFMSLLNSANPYFIVGVQALAAPMIRQYGLETLPMGYIIVGNGGAAGFIGQAQLIPYDKPALAAMYALAAELFGMQFVYLEAGSGAERPVPPEMISYAKSAVEVPLIVGGGLRAGRDVAQAVTAGADIVVTGTVLEEHSGSVKGTLGTLVDAIRQAGGERGRLKKP